jgi:trans-2,3-dihydro-3-hydroxyanthranilate isomerase
MPNTYRYLHLDVFTGTPFEGNQLAVFPEPGGLTDDQMQTVTREMNFSESTFIVSKEASGARMRIFTPGEELPVAGHPTIGSTFALAAEGVIPPGQAGFVFDLKAGPTPVSLDWREGRLAFAWMTQKLPAYVGAIRDRDALAAAIGLTRADLMAGLPAEVVSTGVPFLFVPIASRAAVDSVAIDPRAMTQAFRESSLDERGIFLFTTEGGTSGGETVYSRMLGPGLGIAEDPATGIASGALGCYLLRHNLLSPAQARSMVSLQGVAMKRPSRIHIDIESAGGEISSVRVGGSAVVVGRGELYV